PCAGNQDCGSDVVGLYCDAADTETCLPFPEVGETCVSTGDIRCNIDGYDWRNTNENVCALPEIVQEGEPCNVFAVIDAGARRCAEGLACSSPGATDDDGLALGRCFVPRQLGETCGVVGDGTDACSFIH